MSLIDLFRVQTQHRLKSVQRLYRDRWWATLHTVHHTVIARSRNTASIFLMSVRLFHQERIKDHPVMVSMFYINNVNNL